MAKTNKNEQLIAKLGLWIILPINLLLMLTQSERDVLNTLRHLESIGTKCVSLSLLRLYTGLNVKTIQAALNNLETLGVITKGSSCKVGTYYRVRYEKFGAALKALNQEKNPVERLRIADKFRGTALAKNKALIAEYERTQFDNSI